MGIAVTRVWFMIVNLLPKSQPARSCCDLSAIINLISGPDISDVTMAITTTVTKIRSSITP